MPLSIAEVEVNDLPTITDLAFTAFYASNAVERLTYPHGLTPSVSTSSLASVKRGFLDPDTHYLKIVDTDLVDQEGQPIPGNDSSLEGLEGRLAKPLDPDSSSSIIAFTRFKIWREDRKASDWGQPYSISEGELGAIGDVNLDVARSFRGRQKEMSRINIRGRKCVYMQCLATHPSHQRRGAGTLLLERVVDLARREGLHVYLQASPSGYPLYRKLGFEDVEHFDVDLGTLAGGEPGGESHRTVLMRLRAQGESG